MLDRAAWVGYSYMLSDLSGHKSPVLQVGPHDIPEISCLGLLRRVGSQASYPHSGQASMAFVQGAQGTWLNVDVPGDFMDPAGFVLPLF